MSRGLRFQWIPQTVQVAPIFFGGSARAPGTEEKGRRAESLALLVLGDGSLILEIGWDDRSAYSLCQQCQHFDRARDIAYPRANDLPRADVVGGFCVLTVNFDVTGLASRTGLRSGAVKTNRPKPFIQTNLVTSGGGAHRRGLA